MSTSLPKLPSKAAYLYINNASKRNALSTAVLRDMRDQLHAHLTSPKTGELLILPEFEPAILADMEAGDEKYRWLLDGNVWRDVRAGLPNVIVLRSSGPVFSSGHDLKELAGMAHEDVKSTFALCAEVMRLIRHSPAPVVGAIQGLATAAGLQLALTADYPIALENTPLRLPGASIGLPCSSPATAVSRRLGPGVAYRMLATADTLPAGTVNGSGAFDLVPVSQWEESTDVNGRAFEDRVAQVVEQLTSRTAGQPLAFGKWAFWTQLGIRTPGDGYEDAAAWAGRVMALHARAEDAREGISAFFEKRPAEWKT